MTLSGSRVAIYARYSSDKQSESSIEDQVARCRGFVEARGGAVVDELVFADFAVSGASLARPGFESLMRSVEARLIDVVVTEDASRISRDLGDASSVFKRLAFANVQLFGVADGVDTTAKNAKLTYAVKSLVNDLYLDDLRDKTLRGMVGRARAGLATGGLPFGFRSVPSAAGHAIEIDAERAAIVRRIFTEYASGRSCAAIASALNAEGVAAPRAHSKRRRPGWVASAIRAMLLNAKYVGTWRFGERTWKKVPGTNRRIPVARAEADVVATERPELRIVDDATWSAVRDRFADTAPGGRRARGASPRGSARRSYLLSGLLRCELCGGVMTIHGGESSRRYYGCADAKERGTCSNRLSVREETARTCVLTAIRERLSSPRLMNGFRRAVARVLERASRADAGERDAIGRRLARAENRIRGLIEMQADGDRSPQVTTLRRELEAQVRKDRAELRALERVDMPELPSVDELVALTLNIEGLVAEDVAAARAQLERLVAGGVISMRPREDGIYVAKLGLLPLAAVEMRKPPGEGRRSLGAYGCGGPLRAPRHADFAIPVEFEMRRVG